MKDRPILFSGPMVRAILEGRKTQTRRVIKPHRADDSFVLQDYEDGHGWRPYRSDDGESAFLSDGNETEITCPYGGPGDRLWVRETWRVDEYELSDTIYRADGPSEAADLVKWRPSIYMPRGRSRITLEIAGVRVERVQEITEEDAQAEGPPQHPDWPKQYHCTWRYAYRALWESINGPGAWESNPWVWVIEFTREK